MIKNELNPIFGSEENDKALADACAASAAGWLASQILFTSISESVPYPASPRWVVDAITNAKDS